MSKLLSSNVGSAIRPNIIRYSNARNLQEYAEQSMKANIFSDLCIESGSIRICVHCMVLACYSPFFEKLFQPEMQELYKDTVELNDLNGESVKIVVEFMYTRSITIENKNVFDILATAHFLEMNEVC